MKLLKNIIPAVILSCIIVPKISATVNVKEAIVKIYTVYNQYNYYEPWQMYGQRNRNGSGCIISGRRILTNAHVVGDKTFIQVKRAGRPEKYTAQVKVVSHERDLAILEVSDNSFFTDSEPLKIGDLAEVRDKVAVYGFPTGGDELCITEGVVSRVEHHRYSHSSAYLLTCQIDAAINSGSSGGPVIKNDKIVGIAFQAGGGENIGYMVPVPVINHFLEDIKDGKCDGTPALGIFYQEMENPDIRLKYSMSGKQTGILIDRTYFGTPAHNVLKPGDVILSIDGKNVENDGTIEFRKGERTSFVYAIQNKYIGDVVTIEILREGKVKNVEVRLSIPSNMWRLVPYQQYDVAPTYYILGGLVFEPLTKNFLETWGGKWYDNAPVNLLNYYYYKDPAEDQKEVVVLVKVLADEINIGYHNWRYDVISYVNGKKISSMRDLVNAFEDHKGEYHIIVDEDNSQIVLNKDKVDRNGEKILEKYRIGSDRSEDLKK
ncbi:MAG: trypsin-like peptidase domain-containing protein [Elusimicrobia bacterium]|nr:trypsin-like peptidase domain-containing protein [Elusimicrobiota bacterium]